MLCCILPTGISSALLCKLKRSTEDTKQTSKNNDSQNNNEERKAHTHTQYTYTYTVYTILYTPRKTTAHKKTASKIMIIYHLTAILYRPNTQNNPHSCNKFVNQDCFSQPKYNTVNNTFVTFCIFFPSHSHSIPIIQLLQAYKLDY